MGLVDRDDGWRMPDWLWERIEPLLPPPPEHPLGTHRKGLPKRQVMDAILLVLRTGMQWNALNVTGVCNSSTAHRRFQEWEQAGVFREIWRQGLHPPEGRPRIDIRGVLLAGGGLFALVYGFSNAETHSWTTPLTIVSLAASVVLLAAFVAVERRKTDPLLPLHIVRDRARGGAYLSILLAGAGVFAVFLFLTYYMQESLGFSPIKTGLSFLPMTAALVVTSTTVQTKLLYRTGAKPLVAVGMTLGLIAMLLLTRLSPGASYASHVLPALVITGLGMGCIFAPAFSTATLGIESSEAGVASAMVNTSQQVGGSVGTALLSTIFASATAAYASSHAGTPGVINAAAVHGYTTAFAWAAGIFALGLLLALLILPSKRKSSSPAPKKAVDYGTAIASRSAAPATAILVTGPCCHFGVAVHIEQITLPDRAPEDRPTASRSSAPADRPPPAPK